MSRLIKHLGRAGIALALVIVLAIAAVVPAFAGDVVMTLQGGALTASIDTSAVYGSTLTYSHAVQNEAGSMTLLVDDSTGSGDGWNVTIASSDFVYSGSNGGTDILAANFTLTSAAVPVMTSGQAVSATATFGPEFATQTGTLDVARKVVLAGPSYGQGAYTQALGVSLEIPAQSRAGVYTGVLTTTATAAPGV